MQLFATLFYRTNKIIIEAWGAGGNGANVSGGGGAGGFLRQSIQGITSAILTITSVNGNITITDGFSTIIAQRGTDAVDSTSVGVGGGSSSTFPVTPPENILQINGQNGGTLNATFASGEFFAGAAGGNAFFGTGGVTGYLGVSSRVGTSTNARSGSTPGSGGGGVNGSFAGNGANALVRITF